MSSAPAVTTTSYAILGLLAVRSWSTYELTQQMDRSLGRFWPRAQSKLYEEPRKLVALGLAVGETEQAGGRGARARGPAARDGVHHHRRGSVGAAAVDGRTRRRTGAGVRAAAQGVP